MIYGKKKETENSEQKKKHVYKVINQVKENKVVSVDQISPSATIKI